MRNTPGPHSIDTNSVRIPGALSLTILVSPTASPISTSGITSSSLASGSRPSFVAATTWREKVIGGWSISGILTLHSGYGWTPVYTAPHQISTATSATTDFRTCVRVINWTEPFAAPATAPLKRAAASRIPAQPISGRTTINSVNNYFRFRITRMQSRKLRADCSRLHPSAGNRPQLLSRPWVPGYRPESGQIIRSA